MVEDFYTPHMKIKKFDVSKLRKVFPSFIFYIKHTLNDILTSGKMEDIQGRKVIVSFTTIPSRFNKIRKTLYSLLDQTRIVDEIVISIPEYSKRERSEYNIPDFIYKFIDKVEDSNLFIRTPKITILRSENDWGPATKFIPVLQREFHESERENLIIIVDDDQIYKRTMISKFIKYHKKYPKSVLCNRGRILTNSFQYSNSKIILGTKIDDITSNEIIGLGFNSITASSVKIPTIDLPSFPAIALACSIILR